MQRRARNPSTHTLQLHRTHVSCRVDSLSMRHDVPPNKLFLIASMSQLLCLCVDLQQSASQHRSHLHSNTCYLIWYTWWFTWELHHGYLAVTCHSDPQVAPSFSGTTSQDDVPSRSNDTKAFNNKATVWIRTAVLLVTACAFQFRWPRLFSSVFFSRLQKGLHGFTLFYTSPMCIKRFGGSCMYILSCNNIIEFIIGFAIKLTSIWAVDFPHLKFPNALYVIIHIWSRFAVRYHPPPPPHMVWSKNLRFAAFRMKTLYLQCFLHGGLLARSATLQIRWIFATSLPKTCYLQCFGFDIVE